MKSGKLENSANQSLENGSADLVNIPLNHCKCNWGAQLNFFLGCDTILRSFCIISFQALFLALYSEIVVSNAAVLLALVFCKSICDLKKSVNMSNTHNIPKIQRTIQDFWAKSYHDTFTVAKQRVCSHSPKLNSVRPVHIVKTVQTTCNVYNIVFNIVFKAIYCLVFQCVCIVF